MATGGEKHDENDRGCNRGKVCFVGPPLTLLASPATLNLLTTLSITLFLTPSPLPLDLIFLLN